MNFFEFYKEQVNNPSHIPTDKNEGHNYIETYYNERLTPLANEYVNFLEIGTFKFGSLILFRDWFVNGNVIGMDANPLIYHESEKDFVYVSQYEDYSKQFDKNGLSKTIIPGCDFYMRDAYSQDTLSLFEDVYFDFIVEDGSHALEDQKYAVINWSKKIKPGGILVIEDIQDINHCLIFNELLNQDYEKNTIDLRHLRPSVSKDTILYEIKRLR